ncbi:hypothetical protein RND81_09G097000 [Saponaria officinalis]|uniref:Uncharacterized protein n=1 Tax=Saponaria officinalis TaxID=3572 RepID=A0AAW1IIR1_SAPOF
MVVYNLDETPDVFITPIYMNNEFVYEMAFVEGEENIKRIRSTDLRTDKLMIYGSEVKQSMLKRLYESLIIKPKTVIFVNCNCACYVVVVGKVYKPIYNVIFDWYSFGVIVPNSVNDLLTKQVEKLEKAVENSKQQSELAKIEVESTKASHKASNDEVNELKKVQNELGLKVQKAYEKVALTDFEVELYKIELESCKKELDDVLDDLCCCKDEKATKEVEMNTVRDRLLDELCNSKEEKINMEKELQNKHDQISSINSSLHTKNRELEMKLKSLEDKHSLIQFELHSTKDQQETLSKNLKELEETLSSSEIKVEK